MGELIAKTRLPQAKEKRGVVFKKFIVAVDLDCGAVQK